MNQNNLIASYLEIKNSTYQIVEGDFIEMIKSSLSDRFTLKDITVIYLVEEKTQLKANTSSQIAVAANMAFNTFSNRLKRLEKEGIIQREKNPLNKREHFITLTQEGQKIYQYYIGILEKALKYLFQNLKLKERYQLYRSIIKTANYLNEASNYPLYKQLFKLKETLNHALTDIYDGIYLNEQAFLDENLPEISLKEMRLLLEIYVLSNTSLAIPKNLHESLKIPYSTITHTIQKSEELNIIKKVQNPTDKRSFILSINRKYIETIESFIHLRIKTFENIKAIHSHSEWITVLKTFQLIQSFSSI